MRLKDYNEKSGKRVWLSNEEIELFLDEATSPRQKIAFLLAGRTGLRTNEIINITWTDFVRNRGFEYIRIWEDHTKTNSYREPPISEELYSMVQTLAYDLEPDEPVVDVDKSTVYRWTQRAAERCQAKTGDQGWSYLGPHDLRRTWGTYLLECGVLPSVVMEWGGWKDWSTFREHYLSEFSPEAIERERNKVSYLGGGINEASREHPLAHDVPSGKPHFID